MDNLGKLVIWRVAINGESYMVGEPIKVVLMDNWW